MKQLVLVIVLVAPLSGCAGWSAMTGPEQEAAVQQGVAAVQTASNFLPWPFNALLFGGVGVAGTIILNKKKKS